MTRMIGRRLAAALLFASIVALVPAKAAEPVYPTGSRIGLVPPPGLAPSKGFMGFADAENKVALLLVTMPPEAYAEIEKSITPESLKKESMVQELREPFQLAIGKAFLVVTQQEIGSVKLRKWLLIAATPKLTAFVTIQIPEAARNAYPDAAIRTALASLAIRTRVPDQEQLSLLPFKLVDLAGFKIGNVVPGRALLLSDTDETDSPENANAARMVIATAPATAAQMEDRNAFARVAFSNLAGIDNLRITEAGSLRIGGQQGHQILATGKDIKTGAELTIVQWLRFGVSGFVQMMGVSATKDWKQAYTRFRAVRDSVEPR